MNTDGTFTLDAQTFAKLAEIDRAERAAESKHRKGFLFLKHDKVEVRHGDRWIPGWVKSDVPRRDVPHWTPENNKRLNDAATVLVGVALSDHPVKGHGEMWPRAVNVRLRQS